MFKILPNPEFEAIVDIPTPGGDSAPLTLIFKHKDREGVAEYFDRIIALEKLDANALMDIVAGWKNVDGDFNEENLQKVLDNYHGAMKANSESVTSTAMI